MSTSGDGEDASVHRDSETSWKGGEHSGTTRAAAIAVLGEGVVAAIAVEKAYQHGERTPGTRRCPPAAATVASERWPPELPGD